MYLNIEVSLSLTTCAMTALLSSNVGVGPDWGLLRDNNTFLYKTVSLAHWNRVIVSLSFTLDPGAGYSAYGHTNYT